MDQQRSSQALHLPAESLRQRHPPAETVPSHPPYPVLRIHGCCPCLRSARRNRHQNPRSPPLHSLQDQQRFLFPCPDLQCPSPFPHHQALQAARPVPDAQGLQLYHPPDFHLSRTLLCHPNPVSDRPAPQSPCRLLCSRPPRMTPFLHLHPHACRQLILHPFFLLCHPAVLQDRCHLYAEDPPQEPGRPVRHKHRFRSAARRQEQLISAVLRSIYM